jgi:translation initiation factor 3 subunit L
LAENLSILQNNTDAWDVETVFGYLKKLIDMGMPTKNEASVKEMAASEVQPVISYFSLFGSIVLSRLECLMGDYTASLHALHPVHLYQDFLIAKDEGSTVSDVLQSVFAARLSLAYHAGISFLMLARYKDAVSVLADCAGTMQRGFKTGSLRKQAGSDQFMKQYERILGILAILVQICPGLPVVEDSVIRAVREKHGSKIEAATSYEEWFMSPKFISADPHNLVYRQQVDLFLKEMVH